LNGDVSVVAKIDSKSEPLALPMKFTKLALQFDEKIKSNIHPDFNIIVPSINDFVKNNNPNYFNLTWQ
jgi:hypothetical protein